MIQIYATEPLPYLRSETLRSIFLAGPTPRDKTVGSWRPRALQLLAAMGHDGYVFVPEPADGVWKGVYTAQIEWEEKALNRADCILFWVPRDMETMPALTTNDEWGFWKKSGKVVFGAPPDAVRVRYQRYYANKYRVPGGDTLSAVCRAAVDMVSAR